MTTTLPAKAANITVSSNGRTPESDMIVGIAMILLSAACALAYSVILQAIIRDPDLIRMTSYRFMVVLGVCDVVQCLPHAITGILTITQPEDAYLLRKMLGVLATPFYVGYASQTVILSVQRFVQLASTPLHEKVFSERASKFWIMANFVLVALFMLALASPWSAIVYNPTWYSWDYDRTLSMSDVVDQIETVIEVGGVFLSGILYCGVFALLIRTRRQYALTRSYSMEAKILIQALTITVYCSILNIFWHYYDVLLPAHLWSYCALNFMWICNSGVCPVIYLIVNSVIRTNLKKSASKSTIGPLSHYTNSPNTTEARRLSII